MTGMDLFWASSIKIIYIIIKMISPALRSLFPFLKLHQMEISYLWTVFQNVWTIKIKKKWGR